MAYWCDLCLVTSHIHVHRRSVWSIPSLTTVYITFQFVILSSLFSTLQIYGLVLLFYVSYLVIV